MQLFNCKTIYLIAARKKEKKLRLNCIYLVLAEPVKIQWIYKCTNFHSLNSETFVKSFSLIKTVTCIIITKCDTHTK